MFNCKINENLFTFKDVQFFMSKDVFHITFISYEPFTLENTLKYIEINSNFKFNDVNFVLLEKEYVYNETAEQRHVYKITYGEK